jgi:hypothetical protein
LGFEKLRPLSMKTACFLSDQEFFTATAGRLRPTDGGVAIGIFLRLISVAVLALADCFAQQQANQEKGSQEKSSRLIRINLKPDPESYLLRKRARKKRPDGVDVSGEALRNAPGPDGFFLPEPRRKTANALVTHTRRVMPSLAVFPQTDRFVGFSKNGLGKENEAVGQQCLPEGTKIRPTENKHEAKSLEEEKLPVDRYADSVFPGEVGHAPKAILPQSDRVVIDQSSACYKSMALIDWSAQVWDQALSLASDLIGMKGLTWKLVQVKFKSVDPLKQLIDQAGAQRDTMHVPEEVAIQDFLRILGHVGLEKVCAGLCDHQSLGVPVITQLVDLARTAYQQMPNGSFLKSLCQEVASCRFASNNPAGYKSAIFGICALIGVHPNNSQLTFDEFSKKTSEILGISRAFDQVASLLTDGVCEGSGKAWVDREPFVVALGQSFENFSEKSWDEIWKFAYNRYVLYDLYQASKDGQWSGFANIQGERLYPLIQSLCHPMGPPQAHGTQVSGGGQALRDQGFSPQSDHPIQVTVHDPSRQMKSLYRLIALAAARVLSEGQDTPCADLVPIPLHKRVAGLVKQILDWKGQEPGANLFGNQMIDDASQLRKTLAFHLKMHEKPEEKKLLRLAAVFWFVWHAVDMDNHPIFLQGRQIKGGEALQAFAQAARHTVPIYKANHADCAYDQVIKAFSVQALP